MSDGNFLVAHLIALGHGLRDEKPAAPEELAYTPGVRSALQGFLSQIPEVTGIPGSARGTAHRAGLRGGPRPVSGPVDYGDRSLVRSTARQKGAAQVHPVIGGQLPGPVRPEPRGGGTLVRPSGPQRPRSGLPAVPPGPQRHPACGAVMGCRRRSAGTDQPFPQLRPEWGLGIGAPVSAPVTVSPRRASRDAR